MRIDATMMLVYADGRLLFTAHVAGGPANTIDVLVDDSEELDVAIAAVLRATRRQLVHAVTRDTGSAA
jgi:hypothetical protein